MFLNMFRSDVPALEVTVVAIFGDVAYSLSRKIIKKL